ncbi:hypothetical protein ACFQ07_30230, partial [Actinomadura adrarensis]
GPVHAAAIARELDIPLLVVPRESAIFCAAGMLMCDFKHDYVQSGRWDLGEVNGATFTDIWRDMAARAEETLRGEGIPAERIEYVPSLDMRYRGQWFELNVPLTAESLRTFDRDGAAKGFHQVHDVQFGYHTTDMPIDVLNVRLAAIGKVEHARSDTSPTVHALDLADAAPTGERDIWSPSKRAMVPAKVYDGAGMTPGRQAAGPCVIELGTTSIVVLDDYDAIVDQNGSFVLYLRTRADEMRARLGL